MSLNCDLYKDCQLFFCDELTPAGHLYYLVLDLLILKAAFSLKGNRLPPAPHPHFPLKLLNTPSLLLTLTLTGALFLIVLGCKTRVFIYMYNNSWRETLILKQYSPSNTT